MHPAQKKAVFGMLDALENQIRYIKSIVLIEDEVQMQANPKKAPSQVMSEYLRDEEEDQLEEVQESHRREMLAEEKDIQDKWSELRKVITDEVAL